MNQAIEIVKRELGHLRIESGDSFGLDAIVHAGRYKEAERILKLLSEEIK